MKIPMKVDITTGDEITPKEVLFSYPMLFENRQLWVNAYSFETILAEKYETIVRRGVGNTRARDFYDLHLLFRLYKDNANWEILKQAVIATMTKRNSSSALDDLKRVIDALEHSTFLKELWSRYQSQNLYAREIDFNEYYQR